MLHRCLALVLLYSFELVPARNLSYVGTSVLQRLTATAAAQQGKTWDFTDSAAFDEDWLHYTPSNQLGKPTDTLTVPRECTASDGDRCNTDFGLFKCNESSTCQSAYDGGAPPKCERMEAANGEKLCVGHSSSFYETIYAAIVQTQKKLDISSLSAPDGRFLAAVRSAFNFLHAKHQEIEIRIVLGFASVVPKTDVQGYLQTFLDDLLRDISKSHDKSLLKISICIWEENYLELHDASWNHAKIIAVDGDLLVTGGHNLWTLDYLNSSPVLDMTVKVSGEPAMHGHRFLDTEWTYICAESKDGACLSISLVSH